MTEPERGSSRENGWREAILIAGLVVDAVLLVAAATLLLPPGGQDLVFRSPLPIVVLALGTGLVLWRASRGAARG